MYTLLIFTYITVTAGLPQPSLMIPVLCHFLC